MTRAEHYRKAEAHLDFANQVDADEEGWMDDRTRYHLAAAQVHATLALGTVDVIAAVLP
jgi:hypothetical protein